MTADAGSTDQTPHLPEVVVSRRRGFSVIWLIPIVAAVIAAWLAYKTFSEQGPLITITFTTAQGLEAGKTKIKYKDIEVGTVEAVSLTSDLSQISVSARMHREMADHLTTGTRFWVVRPRLGTGGVSGLDTLVSGSYIEIDPGSGTSARSFTGLEVPPVIRSKDPGQEYILKSATLGSLGPGSPIFFRGILAGEVIEYRLAEDGRSLDIPIFIRAPFDRLIKNDSRFWSVSGIRASLSADGVKIATESLQSIIAGGVAFDSPATSAASDPSPSGTAFILFEDESAIREATYTVKTPYLLHFDGSVRGLSVGAPVEFRGIKIGSVTDVNLEFDPKDGSLRIPVVIETEPQRFQIKGSDDVVTGDPYERAAKLVKRGLRAQLQSGSLLTGQLIVGLDFYPDAPPADLRRGGIHPELPTIPSDIEELKRSIDDVVTKIAALPLNELVQDMRNVLKSLQVLVSSPDLLKSMDALRKTADAATSTLVRVQGAVGAAEQFVGQSKEVSYDAQQLMRELKDTARSFRVLADYLERHPEALIRGKTGAANR
jgi:paraquat-inducible protein B